MNWCKELDNCNVIDFSIHKHLNSIKKEQNLTFRMLFNGEQCFKMGGKELFLFSDSFLVLAPGTEYTSTIKYNKPVRTLSISISNEFLNEFKLLNGLMEYSFFQSIHPLNDEMNKIINDMYAYMFIVDTNECLWNQYINEFLGIYSNSYLKPCKLSKEKLNFVRPNTNNELFKRVYLAKEFIDCQYHTKFTLDQVASACCMSVNHLLRTFKQVFGLSPHQYLIDIRLQRAKYILQIEDKSVKDIVNQVGFESTSSFIKVFREKFNVTPLQYRKLFVVN